MTVTAPITADQAIAEAITQIGVTEQPPGSNRQPFGAWYGMNGVAWCDIFVTWVLAHAGWNDVPHFAATQQHAKWFRDHGAWGTPSITPPRGSVIFFDWGQGIAHVGLVEGHLADGRIATIEGNTDTAGGGSGGRVMRQNRAANIAGYGLITYQTPTPENDMDDKQAFELKSVFEAVGRLELDAAQTKQALASIQQQLAALKPKS